MGKPISDVCQTGLRPPKNQLGDLRDLLVQVGHGDTLAFDQLAQQIVVIQADLLATNHGPEAVDAAFVIDKERAGLAEVAHVPRLLLTPEFLQPLVGGVVASHKDVLRMGLARGFQPDLLGNHSRLSLGDQYIDVTAMATPGAARRFRFCGLTREVGLPAKPMQPLGIAGRLESLLDEFFPAALGNSSVDAVNLFFQLMLHLFGLKARDALSD